MNQVSASRMAIISDLCAIKKYIIKLLIAMINAPKNTKIDLNFHIKSTICPNGIFNTHGKPAQKPKPAKKAAERSRYSLTKNNPTILVNPDTPAAK